MKKALFIDRDGTLVVEPPITYQIDTLEQLEFLPKVMQSLALICQKTDFELVMVTNQDGLGTESYPQANFDVVQNKLLTTLKNEGIEFDDILIDKSFEAENLPTRKPNIGLLGHYTDGAYDLKNSFVIGDRHTDTKLAENLGCKAILIGNDTTEVPENCALYTNDWMAVAAFVLQSERVAVVKRKTHETDIVIKLNLDGTGQGDIHTGLHFFDHMLEQLAKHSHCNLSVNVKGDLEVDEHHTIEDTAIALGEAFYQALGDKRGIERYGFVLPMDDCLCQVALDFGGRSWLVFDADFKREKIGDFPTEMIYHFFKSFSDAAKMNLNIKAEGQNEHHKLEGIFKALAKAVKMAVKRDLYYDELPSTKGML